MSEMISTCTIVNGEESNDHYAILGVQLGCSNEVLRNAFIEKARLFHPDRSRAKSEADFAAVMLAWETLSDPEKRSRYDTLLESTCVTSSVPASNQSVDDHIFTSFWCKISISDMVDEGFLYTYPCRCGDYFEVSKECAIKGSNIFSVLPCGGCTLKVQLAL